MRERLPDYKKMQFVSSSDVVAEVKETLRSYFETGVIDDLLFPTWINTCLRRFRRSSYKIEHTVFEVCDYSAILPDDFKYVREAWMSTIVDGFRFPTPGFTYITKNYKIDRYAEEQDRCVECNKCSNECSCISDGCVNKCDELYQVTEKTNGEFFFSFKATVPLTPGTILCREQCSKDSINRLVSTPHTFDIHSRKFVTNFQHGTVYLTYYADPSYTTEGDIQIPDNIWVREFIKQYLMYKCYEQLFHQVTDETFNQIQNKMSYYDQKQGESFIVAETELKKWSTQQIKDEIQKTKRRYTRFNFHF